MPEPFRSFGELSEAWRKTRRAENRQSYIMLKNLEVSVLETNDTEIASIIVSHPHAPDSRSINLTVHMRQTSGTRPSLLNFHLSEDGILTPEDRRDREIADRLATVLKYHLSDGRAGFWVRTDLRVFTKQSAQEERGEGGVGGGRKKGIDIARQENLREISFQEGALFGFYLNDRKGFPGYVCVVFPDRILLENIAFNHRIYLRMGIPLDLRGCALHHSDPEKRVPQEQKEAIIAALARYLPQEMSKQEFRALPDVTIIQHQGKWQERLRALLEHKGRQEKAA